MTYSFIKYIIACTAVCFTLSVSAQSEQAAEPKGKTETIELKVKGVCGMCQSRIELAVYDIKGVKSAKWDLETDVLTTVVKTGKVSKQQIAEALAEAGHESELMKAKPEAYSELPDCCKYNDGVEKHGDGRR